MHRLCRRVAIDIVRYQRIRAITQPVQFFSSGVNFKVKMLEIAQEIG